MSLAASGSIAKTLVYAAWKGRQYVRQHVIPHNPKSAAQTGMRAMMKFLSQAWASIGTTPQGTYTTLADQTKISPFNAFLKYNLSRWREFQGPTQTNPAAETVVAGTITMGAPAGGPRSVDITLTPSTATNQWTMLLFRDTAAITTVTWDKLVATVAIDGTDPVTYTDSPLAAGTYHYRAALLTNDGNIGVACADQSGVAT
jgi:hypothetical protein